VILAGQGGNPLLSVMIFGDDLPQFLVMISVTIFGDGSRENSNSLAS
jgi:hypothetical protein